MSGLRRRAIEGDVVLRLAATGWDWIHRRSDRVTFVDEMTVQRCTTVELELSERQRRTAPRRGGHLCLPVATLRRTYDLDVMARDGTGATLQVLPREVERRWVAEGIVETVHARYGCWPGDGPNRALAVESARASIAQRLDLGAVDGEFGPLPSEAQRLLHSLVERSKEEYLVIVAVPDPSGSTAEGLVATVVLEQLETMLRVSSTTKHRPAPRSGRLPRGTVLWQYGVDDLLSAGSYHFDLEAAPGTCVVVSSLDFAYAWPSPTGSEVVLVRQTESDNDPKRATLSWNHLGARRAHGLGPGQAFALHTGRTESEGEERRPIVEIGFRPLKQGTMLAGEVAAWASAVTLAALVVAAGVVASGAKPYATWDFDENSLVTLLLIGPTLLITLILQREEHLMTRRIFRRFRGWLTACACATGAAAFWVALGAEGWWRAGPLALPAAVAFVMTVLVQRSYLASGPPGPPPHPKGCACQMPSTCTGAAKWNKPGP